MFTNLKRKQIINSLTQHLKLRFCIDESIQTAIKPLLTISATEDELKMLVDIDMGLFVSQYYQVDELVGQLVTTSIDQ